MYQVRIFSAATPREVEDQANTWLEKVSQKRKFRLIHAAPTDVIQVSVESGIQRYTLVLAYESN